MYAFHWHDDKPLIIQLSPSFYHRMGETQVFFSVQIKNYLILSELGIPTLPLLGYTENAILLPDVDASHDYRLGTESDLNDPQGARAIAKWYRALHEKGRTYLADVAEKHSREIPMYDESDVITLDNMNLAAEKTGSLSQKAADAFLEEYRECFPVETKKADAFMAPLVTLFSACQCHTFPSWAEPSLEELKSGDILRHLKEWLGREDMHE